MRRSLYTGDCLRVLNDLAAIDDRSVDLIYLDPPFNSNHNYNLPFKGKDRSTKPVQAFKDTWEWSDEQEEALSQLSAGPQTHVLADVVRMARHLDRSERKKYRLDAYLVGMAIRLLAMRRVLKPTGTIYLHCDPTASHYLKLIMDGIFGKQHFIDEIIWDYGTPSGGRTSGKKPVKAHETLLVYARDYGKHTYNPDFTPYSEKYIQNWFRHTDRDGRKYQTRSRHGKVIRQYLDQSPGVPLSNVWTDIMQLYGQEGWFPRKHSERLGYPTQKPLDLLERIVETSSNPGDVVMDPFCGCGTATHAAEKLKRQWIGVDISPFATGLIHNRILDHFDGVVTPADIAVYGMPETIDAARPWRRATSSSSRNGSAG